MLRNTVSVLHRLFTYLLTQLSIVSEPSVSDVNKAKTGIITACTILYYKLLQKLIVRVMGMAKFDSIRPVAKGVGPVGRPPPHPKSGQVHF